MLRGDDLRSNLPWVCLTGIAVVTVCDLIGRTIIAPFEMPVSVILGVVGAAVFSHERDVSSSSLDVRYVRQIPLVQPVTVRAEVLHDGRSWGISQVKTRDERGRVCAVATVTVYGRR